MSHTVRPLWRERLWALFDSGSGHGRLVAMEGLRGVAVLLVFLVHFHTLFEPYVDGRSPLHAASAFGEVIGHAGVDLFFILSGYLIYGGFFRSSPPLAQYFRRRAQRIHPTFLVVLAIYLLLSLAVPGESKIRGSGVEAAGYILANVMLLPGMLPIVPVITVAWSLSYEWFYYLFVPALVTLTRMRRWSASRRVALFTALGAAHVAVCVAYPGLHPRLAMFLAGMVLYERIGAKREARPAARAAELGALGAFATSLVAVYLLRGSHPSHLVPGAAGRLLDAAVDSGSARVAVLALPLYAFVRESLGRNGILHRALAWKPLRALGNMSYSYYLIHGLALKVLSVGLARAGAGAHAALFCALFPAGLAATLAAAAGLFVLVEKPLSLQQNIRMSYDLIVGNFRAPAAQELPAEVKGSQAVTRPG